MTPQFGMLSSNQLSVVDSEVRMYKVSLRVKLKMGKSLKRIVQRESNMLETQKIIVGVRRKLFIKVQYSIDWGWTRKSGKKYV